MREGARPRARFFEIALAVQVVVALAGQVALAEAPKRAAAPVVKNHPSARPAPKKAAPAPPARTRDPSQVDGNSGPGAGVGTPAAMPAGGGMSSDGGVVEAKTLDGGTHVFKFSELDIEGRLKSPQLVYFLRRVRAEFAAGDLGHRSFLREMSETRKESSF